MTGRVNILLYNLTASCQPDRSIRGKTCAYNILEIYKPFFKALIIKVLITIHILEDEKSYEELAATVEIPSDGGYVSTSLLIPRLVFGFSLAFMIDQEK